MSDALDTAWDALDEAWGDPEKDRLARVARSGDLEKMRTEGENEAEAASPAAGTRAKSALMGVRDTILPGLPSPDDLPGVAMQIASPMTFLPNLATTVTDYGFRKLAGREGSASEEAEAADPVGYRGGEFGATAATALAGAPAAARSLAPLVRGAPAAAGDALSRLRFALSKSTPGDLGKVAEALPFQAGAGIGKALRATPNSGGPGADYRAMLAEQMAEGAPDVIAAAPKSPIVTRPSPPAATSSPAPSLADDELVAMLSRLRGGQPPPVAVAATPVTPAQAAPVADDAVELVQRLRGPAAHDMPADVMAGAAPPSRLQQIEQAVASKPAAPERIRPNVSLPGEPVPGYSLVPKPVEDGNAMLARLAAEDAQRAMQATRAQWNTMPSVGMASPAGGTQALSARVMNMPASQRVAEIHRIAQEFGPDVATRVAKDAGVSLKLNPL